MADGTYLNNVFAAHIHKSNAQVVLEDMDESISHARERLLILAASAPIPTGDDDDWASYVHREVGALLDEFAADVLRRFMAGYIAESPDDCQDELVDEDWPNVEVTGR